MSVAFEETAFQMILKAAFSAFGYSQDEEKAVYTSSAADMESEFYYSEVTAAANEPQHNIVVVHHPVQEFVSIRIYCDTHRKYLPDTGICNKCKVAQMAALVHPK